jgi:hypothetical protein
LKCNEWKNTSPILVDAGNLWAKPPFGKTLGAKDKMPKRQLEKESSTETKDHMRLKEEIKGTIRAINNNPSREKPRVTY